MNKVSLCLLLLVLPLSKLAAQIDTLQVTGRPVKKFRFLLSLDARYSFINRRNANIAGLRAQVELIGLHRFGIGLYSLSNTGEFERVIEVTDELGTRNVRSSLDFAYWATFYERVIYRRKKLEVSVQPLLGYGNAGFKYLKVLPDNRTVQVDYFQEPVLLLETSAVVHYRIFRWFGVSGGLGYRFILVRNENVSDNLNSPIVIAQFKFFPGEVYRMVKEGKEKRRERKGG